MNAHLFLDFRLETFDFCEPLSMKVFRADAELDLEDIRQIGWRLLTYLLQIQVNPIIPHDSHGIRTANETTTMASYNFIFQVHASLSSSVYNYTALVLVLQ